MRRIVSSLFAGILCLACIISCTKEINPDSDKFVPSGKTREVTLSASFEATTKVAIDDARKVTWVEGDAISIFDGANNIKAEAMEISADGSTAKFKVAIDENAKTVYALYPYTESASFENAVINGVLNMGVSQDGEFGGENPAYVVAAKAAVTDKTLHFQHVSALVRFTTQNAGAQKVIFRGNDGEMIAGESAVTFSQEGVVTAFTSSASEITLDVNGAGTYYIATLPVTLSRGFKFIICDAQGKHLKEKATMSACTIRMGAIMNLDNVDSRLHDHHHITNTLEFEEFLAKAPTAAADDNEWWLDVDLDLKGITLTPAATFAGKLYGGAHALINWETSGPFITTLQAGGVVSDLIIDETCVLNPTPGSDNAFIVGRNYGTVLACENYADITGNFNAQAQVILGSICGRCYGSGSSVQACHNKGNFDITLTNPVQTQYIGGIVGCLNSVQTSENVVRASGCTNSGNITISQRVDVSNQFKTLYIGGIAGASGVSNGGSTDMYNFTKIYGLISQCKNTGDIKVVLPVGATGGYTNLGGIVGYFEGAIKNCTNGQLGKTSGKVSLEATKTSETQFSRPAVGGIAGYVSRTVDGCNNYGAVKLVGFFGNAANQYGSGCGTFTGASCGGIAGCAGDGIHKDTYARMDFGQVKDCHNYGSVTVDTSMKQGNQSSTGCGGVVGWTRSDLTSCTNEGAVNIANNYYNANFGGICGRADADLISCTNKGAVTVNHTPMESEGSDYLMNAGGVVGYANAGVSNCSTTTAASLTVEDSSLSYTRVGGVVGMYSQRDDSSRKFTECTNNAVFSFKKTGNYTSEDSKEETEKQAIMYFGGVVGYMDNSSMSVSKLYNNGALSVTMGMNNANSFAGGIVGSTKSTKVLNCENTGSVTVDCGGATNRIYVGGILGRNSHAAFDIEDCTNRGNILIKNKTGNTIKDYCTAGGIYGGWEDKFYNKIIECYSFCDVTSEAQGAVRLGGIAGCLYGEIVGKNVAAEPTYKGTLTANNTTSDVTEVGGVAGYFGGRLYGITAQSTIKCNRGYAAGMVGYYNYTDAGVSTLGFTSVVEYNWITTTITGGSMVGEGGFFGEASGPTFNLNSCVVNASLTSGALGGMIGIAPANENLNWGSKGGAIRTILNGPSNSTGLVCGIFKGTFTEDYYGDRTRKIDLGSFSFNNCVINGVALWDRRTSSGLLSSSSNSSLWCGDYRDSKQRYWAINWDRLHRIDADRVIIYKGNENDSERYPN